MLTLNAKWLELLDRDPIITVAFIELTNVRLDGNAATTLRWTDYPNDLVFAGDTWAADMPITAMDWPDKSSGEIGRDLYVLELSDSGEPRYSDAIGESFLGIGLSLFVRLFDDRNNTFTTPLNTYRGQCINASLTTDDNDQLPYRLTFSGPLRKLDEEFAITTAKHNQQQRDPNDTALDYAHSSRDLKWARK